MANMIQSQSLFYEDPYCTRFSAKVNHLEPGLDGTYVVNLDRTYFYPTGGGQEHDTGKIGDARVLEVLRNEETGVVNHTLDKPIPVGVVDCEIDWQRRLRNMQHHSGQHLLTQCILRLFDFPTVSANINAYTPSTLDIVTDRILSQDELNQAEELANQVIYENRPIHTYFVEPAELDKVPLRRPPKVSQDIRIVEIDDFDYSACGGTHCSQTGAIGVVKILKNERINNKTRVHFSAGYQALHTFRSYHTTIATLASQLSSSTQDLASAVIRLDEALKQSHKEIQTLKHQQLNYEAQSIISQAIPVKNKRFVFFPFENRPAGELRLLADVLKSHSNLVAVLTSYDAKRLSIVVSSGKDTDLQATLILRQMLDQFGGRGGGDSQLAQGGGPVTNDRLEQILSAGIQSVKEML